MCNTEEAHEYPQSRRREHGFGGTDRWTLVRDHHRQACSLYAAPEYAGLACSGTMVAGVADRGRTGSVVPPQAVGGKKRAVCAPSLSHAAAATAGDHDGTQGAGPCEIGTVIGSEDVTRWPAASLPSSWDSSSCSINQAIG